MRFANGQECHIPHGSVAVSQRLVEARANQPREKINVVWHKCTDLRLHDHEASSLAHSIGFPVLHLFVVDPFWWAPAPLTSLSKTGPFRTRFLMESLVCICSVFLLHIFVANYQHDVD